MRFFKILGYSFSDKRRPLSLVEIPPMVEIMMTKLKPSFLTVETLVKNIE